MPKMVQDLKLKLKMVQKIKCLEKYGTKVAIIPSCTIATNHGSEKDFRLDESPKARRS